MRSRLPVLLSLTAAALIASAGLFMLPAATAQTAVFPTLTLLPSITPVIQPTVIPTLPAGFTPPAPTRAGCAQPLPLYPNALVSLIPGISVRSAPSVSAALVNYYTSVAVLRVQNGPVCADGYNWWLVAGSGEPGWVIEGRPGRYFLTQLVEPGQNCPIPQPLTIGGTAVNARDLAVRAEPVTGALALSVVPARTLLTVVAGPACGEDMNWWQVTAPFGIDGQMVTGWVTEGMGEELFVAAYPPPTPDFFCRRALRLNPGTTAAVTYNDRVPRYLRTEPGVHAPIVQRLIGGVAFEITGAPECVDGFNWFPVRILTTTITGWLAEGQPGAYWFNIITQR
ncbi:MAG TPA: hypothetical protein VER79_07320 [Candidatus Limnocylindrales bacterium]|nr:hypothetical protein [Candidatus Limnocylindrales bacterium]